MKTSAPAIIPLWALYTRLLVGTWLSLCAYASDATGNILFSNDDGWATAQVRAAFDAVNQAGYNVLLSCPAVNQSGSGSLSTRPTNITTPCEFNSCAAGSGTEGFNATDPRLNWVNGYPVDAVGYGIQTLVPQFFTTGKPDFVVSGPNIGANGGLSVLLSGTIGAAVEASNQGIPAAAFSGVSGSQVSYTTLESDPTGASTVAANTYAALTVKVINALFSGSSNSSSSGITLPSGTILNINFPSTDSGSPCSDPSTVQFILTRIFWNPFATDVSTCDRTGGQLPLETDTYTSSGGCYASVSVMDASSKLDAGSAQQADVLKVLEETLPLSCLPTSS